MARSSRRRQAARRPLPRTSAVLRRSDIPQPTPEQVARSVRASKERGAVRWSEVTAVVAFRDWMATLGDPFADIYARALPDPTNMHDGHIEPDSELSSTLRALAPQAAQRYQTAQDQSLRVLTEAIEGVDPLPLLSGAILMTHIRPWGQYFEPAEFPNMFDLEIIAGIVASLPTERQRRPATAEDLANVLRLARLVNYWAHALKEALSFTDEKDAKVRAEGQIRNELLTRWLAWRGDAYPIHAESAAKALVGNHEREFEIRMGFSVHALIDLSRALQLRWERLVTPALEAAWKQARLVTQETPVSIDKGSKQFRQAWTQSAMENLAEALSVPADGKAQLLARDQAALECSIFEAISIQPGDGPEISSVLFDPPQRTRPFLMLPASLRGDETPDTQELRRALLVNPYALTTDLHMIVESLLATKSPRWPRARARAVDNYAIDLLTKSLPGSQSVTNVLINCRNGLEEIDGVVLFEDIALVVEGKGAPLKLAARRGSVDKFISQLRELVGEGQRQLARDHNFMLQEPPRIFYNKSGDVALAIERKIRRCYQILPCLDGLGDIGA